MFEVEMLNEKTKTAFENLPINLKVKMFENLELLKSLGVDLGMPYLEGLGHGYFELRAKVGEDIAKAQLVREKENSFTILDFVVEKIQKRENSQTSGAGQGVSENQPNIGENGNFANFKGDFNNFKGDFDSQNGDFNALNFYLNSPNSDELKKIAEAKRQERKKQTLLMQSCLDPKFKERYEKSRTNFDIKKRLIQTRTKAGLSQAKIAKIMGVSQTMVARFENSEFDDFKFSTLRKYLIACGKDFDIVIKDL